MGEYGWDLLQIILDNECKIMRNIDAGRNFKANVKFNSAVTRTTDRMILEFRPGNLNDIKPIMLTHSL